jgi:hypothetical protein
MLVELDGSAIDDALAGAAMPRGCIENFLLAHHAGKHLFWLDSDHRRVPRSRPAGAT